MNIRDRQTVAVAMAVRKAVNEIGLKTIKSGEFFGMNQPVAVEYAKCVDLKRAA